MDADDPSLAPADTSALEPQASSPAGVKAGKDGAGSGCAPGQELAYNEDRVYCAGEAGAHDGGIPNCREGEVLTGSGGHLVCIAPAAESGALCGLAVRRAASGYASLAKCRGHTIVTELAPNSWSAPNCPKGYELQEIDVSGTGTIGLLTCTKD